MKIFVDADGTTSDRQNEKIFPKDSPERSEKENEGR